MAADFFFARRILPRKICLCCFIARLRLHRELHDCETWKNKRTALAEYVNDFVCLLLLLIEILHCSRKDVALGSERLHLLTFLAH